MAQTRSPSSEQVLGLDASLSQAVMNINVTRARDFGLDGSTLVVQGIGLGLSGRLSLFFNPQYVFPDPSFF